MLREMHVNEKPCRSSLDGQAAKLLKYVDYPAARPPVVLGSRFGASMNSKSRRAVMTGIGLICPLGSTKEALWEALSQAAAPSAP